MTKQSLCFVSLSRQRIKVKINHIVRKLGTYEYIDFDNVFFLALFPNNVRGTQFLTDALSLWSDFFKL